jgi:hypothetical protein
MKAKEKHKNKIACCGTIRWGLHRTDLKVRKMSFDETWSQAASTPRSEGRRGMRIET